MARAAKRLEKFLRSFFQKATSLRRSALPAPAGALVTQINQASLCGTEKGDVIDVHKSVKNGQLKKSRPLPGD